MNNKKCLLYYTLLDNNNLYSEFSLKQKKEICHTISTLSLDNVTMILSLICEWIYCKDGTMIENLEDMKLGFEKMDNGIKINTENFTNDIWTVMNKFLNLIKDA
jgi:hypothetical protein